MPHTLPKKFQAEKPPKQPEKVVKEKDRGEEEWQDYQATGEVPPQPRPHWV